MPVSQASLRIFQNFHKFSLFSPSNHLRILRYDKRQESPQSGAYKPLEDRFRQGASAGAGNRAANGLAELILIIRSCRLLDALACSTIVLFRCHDPAAAPVSPDCSFASSCQVIKAGKHDTASSTNSTEPIDATTSELFVKRLIITSSVSECSRCCRRCRCS